MPRWPVAVSYELAALAVVLSVLACRNVAASDAATWWRNTGRVLVRGPFVGREVFTPRGWRYRNGALLAAALAALMLFFV